MKDTVFVYDANNAQKKKGFQRIMKGFCMFFELNVNYNSFRNEDMSSIGWQKKGGLKKGQIVL